MNTTPIIIIGRGHGGTRAVAKLLVNSGVFMGKYLGETMDMFPHHWLLEAARIAGRRVKIVGDPSDWKWNFGDLVNTEPTEDFRFSVYFYAWQSLSRPHPSGWKIPVSTFCYPWLIKMFPDAYYIQWVRDPRDAILRTNFPDGIMNWGAPGEYIKNAERSRLQDWTYQASIIDATPEPKRFITVRLEDFVQDNKSQVDRLSDFLSIKLNPIPVKPEVVGRHKKYENLPTHPEATRLMKKFGYI